MKFVYIWSTVDEECTALVWHAAIVNLHGTKLMDCTSWICIKVSDVASTSWACYCYRCALSRWRTGNTHSPMLIKMIWGISHKLETEVALAKTSWHLCVLLHWQLTLLHYGLLILYHSCSGLSLKYVDCIYCSLWNVQSSVGHPVQIAELLWPGNNRRLLLQVGCGWYVYGLPWTNLKVLN